MFMQYKSGTTKQAPEWLAAKLPSGQRLRCPEVSPCPIKWSAAHLPTP